MRSLGAFWNDNGASGRAAGCLSLALIVLWQILDYFIAKMPFWEPFETVFFSITCLAVVTAAADYLQKPGSRKAVLLGCAIGASLLVQLCGFTEEWKQKKFSFTWGRHLPDSV